MENLKNLDTNALIELLAKHTREYTQMLADHEKGENFIRCRDIIDNIQKEISSRVHNKENLSANDH